MGEKDVSTRKAELQAGNLKFERNLFAGNLNHVSMLFN